MVAIKSHQANAFLAAVERVPPAVLLYGSDVGLVSERASLLARRLAERDDPPGEIIRLDDAVLEEDPDRVFVELQTLPMFGGRKVVRATAGRRITAALLAPLVESGGLEASLIVEAGNLRPDDALRGLFEKARAAAAVACYPDEARDLEGVVREVLAAAKLDIAPEAKRLLLARLGADRALSRAEIEKLALYAHGKRVIDEADVEAAVGDAAGARYEPPPPPAAGESPQAVISALQRHFLRLHRMRSALEAGRSMDDIVRAQRPPLHFKQRDAIEQQCRAWSLARLGPALAHIAEAARAARLNPALEATLAERLLLDLQARAKGR